MCIYTFLSLDFCTSKIHIIFSPPLHFILFQRFGHTKSSIYMKNRRRSYGCRHTMQGPSTSLSPGCATPLCIAFRSHQVSSEKNLAQKFLLWYHRAPMHQAKPHWVTVYIHSIHHHFTDSFSINFSLIVFRKVRIFGSSRFQAPFVHWWWLLLDDQVYWLVVSIYVFKYIYICHYRTRNMEAKVMELGTRELHSWSQLCA